MPGDAARDQPDLAVAQQRGHGVPDRGLVPGADADHQPHDFGEGQRRTHGVAQHGGVAEGEQHLVGLRTDPGAGPAGEDHDGRGHAQTVTCLLHDERQGKHAVPRFGDVPHRVDHVEWQPVCRLAELEVERGAAALVHGQAVAIFRVDQTTVYALGNHDPFDRHATLARGIVGVMDGVPFVASPQHKHGFDLRTGECLDDPQVSVAAYDVKVLEGVVLVGHRKTAAA